MIGKYGPLEISSWFRSGLSHTGAKPSLIFGGGHQRHMGWMREASINSNMYIWSPQTTRTAARVALTPLIDAYSLM